MKSQNKKKKSSNQQIQQMGQIHHNHSPLIEIKKVEFISHASETLEWKRNYLHKLLKYEKLELDVRRRKNVTQTKK